MDREKTVISVENLSVAYETDTDQLVLKNISFQIEYPGIFGILGLSGCGKTTLCMSLAGIIPNLVEGHIAGEIFIRGNNIKGQPVNRLAGTIGYVMQNPDDQLICTTLEDELAFAPENLAKDPKEIRAKVDHVLAMLGMESLRLMNPNQLSGGQKKMAAIGAILMLDPDILILDEPMSALDAEGRSIVINLLLYLRASGKTIIVVEHDVESIRFADRWLIMSAGRLIAQGCPSDFVQDNLTLAEHMLL